jgi:hypothetical protein
MFLWHVIGFDPHSLILPFGIFVSIYFIKEIIAGTFEGKFLPNLTGSLIQFALGLFGFFFASSVANMMGGTWPVIFRFLGWFILFACLLAGACQLLEYPARRHPAASISIKASALAALAFLWMICWRIFAPNLQSILFNMVFYGFLFSAIGSALSLLSLSQGRLRTVGRRLGRGVLMFVAGAVFALYLYSLRKQLMGSLGGNFPIFEWTLVSVTVGLAALGLVAGATKMSESLWFANWMRHTQIVELCSDEELEYLTTLARDFIEKGDRGGIAVYLADLANRAKIPPNVAARVLSDLLNYVDEELPWLVKKNVARSIHLRNMEMRRRILQATIEKLEDLAYA